MGKELLLKCEQMCKSFGPTKAVNHVDLEVFRGEIRGLIGENGSGKSTISSIIAGVQPCDSGTMYYNGNTYTPKPNLIRKLFARHILPLAQFFQFFTETLL